MTLGRSLVPGHAQGPVHHTDVPLSFWMGIDTSTGEVIDRHHPSCGTDLAGSILVIPGGRGSCSGSCAIAELIVGGHAPAGLVFEHDEPILTLGVLVAREIFGKSIPVASVGPDWFALLRTAQAATISDHAIEAHFGETTHTIPLRPVAETAPALVLSDVDRAMLDGVEGRAAQTAMRIVTLFAELLGVTGLIDVGQAHIDCCFYTGPAGLAFAERLAGWGARVRVPTTTNATSVDVRRWRTLGIDPRLGNNSDRVAAAYVGMGARASFTCAPYLLSSAPLRGQQIAWGESNAVAFANSVLGARTMKYPDFLDVCAALTGRAPMAATHLAENRGATVHIGLDALDGCDDALYPLLGYHVGAVAGHDIPAVTGLEAAAPNRDDLKAFSAAFATTSGAPMFHIVGVTPEAPTLERAAAERGFSREVRVSRADLRRSWSELNATFESAVGLVALGNPHFSLTEIARTATFCRGRTKARTVQVRITCGRDIHAQATQQGLVADLERFGIEFQTDTCWCMLDRQQVSAVSGSLMTNSAKFAHYGPGITGRPMHFGSLAACIEAACTGANAPAIPSWLAG